MPHVLEFRFRSLKQMPPLIIAGNLDLFSCLTLKLAEWIISVLFASSCAADTRREDVSRCWESSRTLDCPQDDVFFHPSEAITRPSKYEVFTQFLNVHFPIIPPKRIETRCIIWTLYLVALVKPFVELLQSLCRHSLKALRMWTSCVVKECCVVSPFLFECPPLHLIRVV